VAVQQLLKNKFLFIPVINVDGLHDIEDNNRYRAATYEGGSSAILPRRKNLNDNGGTQRTTANCEMGVDLNRNYAVDWKLNDMTEESKNPCSEFFAGQSSFSEPETQAIKAYLETKKDDLKFVINFHSNGNSFIWPFNGRENNDIERRAPGVLAIMKDIVKNAKFPADVKTGNSYEVIREKVGGDADDYITATYGIPSVTSELGVMGQFSNDWVIRSKEDAYEILSQNTKWVDYVFNHLPQYTEDLAKVEVSQDVLVSRAINLM
jgi:hypothetical protein